MEGEAEPSLQYILQNPPYFYRQSGTGQTSVLFRRGPCIVYAVTKIRQKSPPATYIYVKVLRAKMWRYGFRGRRHRLRCETQGQHDVMPLLKSMKKSTSLRCGTKYEKKQSLQELKMPFLFLIHSEHIQVTRRSHSNEDVVRHLGFLNRNFGLLMVYKRSL